MIEKTEWEVVDAPSPGARPTLRQLLQGVLGPHWYWKLAGMAVVASLALVLFATITGVILVLAATGALLSFGIGKFRQWMAHGRGAGAAGGELDILRERDSYRRDRY
ncbi:hypothetical protein [Noviherbaspirillum massiliense]|uniref:hypothetical protein n=1 Tax=Noviherbaspirillum massiliense TaxID=1465823 RepID=UPI0002F48432|nr:hypothetical protein [Noviherbaspirillum massiliense]